jgi:hypothetical protein
VDQTYRKLTFLGLALIALNVVGRVAIADYLIENVTLSDDWPFTLARIVHLGGGIALSALFTLCFAYLWRSSRGL